MPREDFDNAGAYVSIKDLLGATVLFSPSEYVEEVTTSFGTKDAVTTDIVVLSEDNAEYYDVMVFQGAIIARLKRNIQSGRPVVGVIAKGEAKKGQNAPYVLEPADEQGVNAARAYLAANPDFIRGAKATAAAPGSDAVSTAATPVAPVSGAATVSSDEDPWAV